MRVKKENRLYKLFEFIGKQIILFFEYLIELFTEKIVFDNPYRIKGVKELENNTGKILKEFHIINENHIIPGIDEFFEEQKQLAQNKSWKSFPLFIYGNEFKDNTEFCPITRNSLTKIAGFKSAMFSILSAKQTIPPHRGPFKGLMRIHLGLIVPNKPNQECYIKVDGIKKSWKYGKTIMFDDTHIHAAYNETSEDRVVLFIDVLRPLPFPLAFLNKLLFTLIANSPFIKETMEKYKLFGNNRFSKIK